MNRINKGYLELPDIQLHKTRERFVAGEGTLNPRIMFIGDIPGLAEAKCGQALAGQRKAMVNLLVRGIDLKLEHVYTTYIMKFRTHGGRDPKPIELESTLPLILKEIEVAKPDVVITWGRYTLDAFAKGQRLQDVHGQQILSDHGFMFVPMFSPDAAMVNDEVAKMIIRDFQPIRNLV